MPDPFFNARAYFDPTFPSSGDSFSIHGMRNALNGLGFLDILPLQPRAHSPGDLRIMVRGQDASQFYNPVYFGDANERIPFSSGDTTAFAVPASNPRVDIVYMTPSGDYRIAQGTEAVNPSLPTLSPSGDSRFPIAAVWCKPGMTKIVNFEDKDSNSGDGYIYKDLRPWMRTAGAGGTSLTNVTPVSVTGDNAVGVAGSAARADHRHQGVHNVRVVGSGDLYGDVQFHGENIRQSGNRITVNGIIVQMRYKETRQYGSSTPSTLAQDDSIPQISETRIIIEDSIKPRFADSKIMIIGDVMVTHQGSGQGALAMFKDSGVNAIAAKGTGAAAANQSAVITHEEGAVNTTSRLYSIGAGNNGGFVVHQNGDQTGRIFGGMAVCSITIIEYKPTPANG